MKDNSGKVLLALLAGASAGIVAGLLMAPDSGTVSRDNLKKYAGKLSKDLEKTFQENYNKLSSLDAGALLGSLGLSGKGDAGAGGGASTSGSTTGGSASGGNFTTGSNANASGSVAGAYGTDASAGGPPRGGRAAGGTNPTGAGPEVGEDA